MKNCTNCPVNDGYKPAEAVHQIAESVPSIESVMHALRASHARTTKGEWGQGDTTHKTVAKRGAGEPYRVAEFRHAADAQFCDLAHAFVPRLIAEVEAQHARIAELEAELEAIGAGGVESLRKQAAAQQAAPDERAEFEHWLGIKPCGAAHDFGWAAWQARAALAATPPTTQGLDALDAARYRFARDSDSDFAICYWDDMAGYNGEWVCRGCKGEAIDLLDAALAAQAKQGGAA